MQFPCVFRPAPLLAGALFLSLSAPMQALVLNSPHPIDDYSAPTIYTAFGGRSPKTLDPQRSYSSDETVYTYSIYEPLYQYHYLKRPYVLEPRTAVSVAEPRYLGHDGRELPADADPALIAESVYDIRIKPGILYAPHPAFARDAEGRLLYHALSPEDARTKRSPADFPRHGTRELTAEDYVYGIRRLASPRVVSPVLGTLSSYIIGLGDLAKTLREKDAALRAAGRQAEWLDLRDAPFEGVTAPDPHTLRIRVRGKYPQFSNWLTMAFFAPVPWEAERFYSQKGLADNNFTLNTWPVGTGPFMMSVFEENRRHEMVRNPNFRRETYPCEGEPSDRENGYLEGCGKPLPLVERAVFDIEKEAVPLQTKFLQGWYDSPSIDRVDTGLGFLVAMGDSPDKAALYKEKQLKFPQTVEASLWYIGFNWLDPVLGGTGSPEAQRRARLLRQAISIAVDWDENLAIFQKSQGIAAHGPIPPGLFGWQDDGPSAFNPVVYKKDASGRTVRRSIEEARALMHEAGYPDGRDAVTGRPLVLSFDYQNASQGSKSYLEWYQKQFAKLGIQLDIRATDYNRFQDKMARGAAQIFLWGWVADYPDAENFLFLFYGPNAKVLNGGENASNYSNPEFDRAFEAMKYLEDGPEKQRLINRMISIMQEDAPIMFGYFPKAAAAFQSWVTNAKPTSMIRNSLQYIGIDARARREAVERWNRPVLWPLLVIAAGAALLVLFARRVWKKRDSARLRPVSEGDRS
ncbi:MAG: ABC transporter substrate-binding protein [Sutterella sp.]|nr:ABC transporter substrate-binding protein [Sutterella sp.]